jgi:high-affinity Fe2+/Pb2+ permease
MKNGFNTEAKDNQKTESGWPVVISVILSLILGAGVMMIFLAIGFEQFFMYQIEEARKISQ